MATPKHEIYVTNRGEEKKIRRRFVSQDLVRYTLTGADVFRRTNLLFQAMAEKFYSDESLHWIIRDNNEPKWESDFQVGEEIFVPADYRNAISSPEGAELIGRQIYSVE